jgi:YD repeat-containing protein
LSLLICMSIVIIFSACQKTSLSNTDGAPGYGIKGFLKQYSFYYTAGGTTFDSMIVNVTYDTVGHSIVLDMETTFWKYQYDAFGYLVSVRNITPGPATGELIDSFMYDGNRDLSANITYQNILIPYNTVYSSSGKTVTMYDTTYSGFLGGTIFGTGTIVFNTQNQVTDRFLNYGGNAWTSAVVQDHETFSYDGSNQITQYALNETRWVTLPDGTPNTSVWSGSETYDQRDNKPNPFYQFDSLLLKGVLNMLGGNALIDPLANTIGYGKTYYFQSQHSALMQGSFENGYNFSDQPIYDGAGRLIQTSVYDFQIPGIINIKLSYY